MNYLQKLYEDLRKLRKLVSSSELPILLGDNLNSTSVLFFIEHFNLLSCEFDSFTCELLCLYVLY